MTTLAFRKPLVVYFCISAFLLLSSVVRAQTLKEIAVDDGRFVASNPLTAGWEESIILPNKSPCTIHQLRIYYTGGTGPDTVRIVGDAGESAIPPTQYCWSYNTIGNPIVVDVGESGWKTINVSNISIGGYDRIIVQHRVYPGGPHWGMDAAQGLVLTSFVYDPITPNADFYNIPGIYYRARGDFMVRTSVAYAFPDSTGASLPMPPAQFRDVTTISGISGANGAVIKSAMASIADIDADGFDDIVIGGSNLFSNNGDGTFTRRQATLGGHGTVWADINRDGFPDVFAAANGAGDKLFLNNGDWTFRDVTANSGIVNDAPSVAPLWLDFDADGFMDLFIANGRTESGGSEVYFQDRLWRNKGDGTFENVTTESGIAQGESSPYHDCWGATLCDFNNDGRTDIFVATYRLAPDRLFRNNGNGTFSEVSQQTGIRGMATSVPSYYGHGMGADWGDVNGDGLADCAVGNLGHPDSRAQYSNPSLIWINDGTQFEPKIQSNGGVGFREFNAGMCFIDFDNDGDEDLFHGKISYDAYGSGPDKPAMLYKNTNAEFRDVTWQHGLFIHGAWTGVRIDFDRDGDVDLLCASSSEHVKLFRNDVAGSGNSLTIQLDAGTSNQMVKGAYGSRIVVHAAGRQIHRWLPGSLLSGRAAQMSHDMFVGLGSAIADSIDVYWPNGTLTTHRSIPTNSVLLLTPNGKSQLRMLHRPRQTWPPNQSSGLSSPAVLRWICPSQVVVMISKDPKMENADTIFSGSADSITYNGEANTVYYWRISVQEDGAKHFQTPIWRFTIGKASPSGVILLSPADSALSVHIQPLLRWTRASLVEHYPTPITYTAELSTHPNFVTDISRFFHSLSDTTFNIPASSALEPSTLYYWRVKADAFGAASPWSNTHSFTTYSTPSVPTLINPSDGSMLEGLRPTFTWTQTHDADTFEVHVDTNSSFATAIPRFRTDTIYTPIVPLKSGRTYHWRVRGINSVGIGPWTPVNTFVPLDPNSVHFEFAAPDVGTIRAMDLLGRTVYEGSTATFLGNGVYRGLFFIVPINGKGAARPVWLSR